MNTDLARSPMAAFSTREWVSWLAYGIRAYFRLTVAPPSFSPNDAFPYAKLYVGINHNDLAADLVDMHRDLPALSQARFEEGAVIIWAELDFDRAEHFKVGSIILGIARKGRFKSILDILPAAIPRLKYMQQRLDLSEAAAGLRTEMFAAAIDLASATPKSASTITALLDAQRRNPDFQFAKGNQVLSGLVRLCRSVPSEIEGWIALFAYALSEAFNLKERLTSRFVLSSLQQACGEARLSEAVARARGLVATDTSPIEGFITFNNRLEADALIAALVPLPRPGEMAQNIATWPRARSQLSVSEVAGALNVG